MTSLPAPTATALARLLPADVDLGPSLRVPSLRPVWLGIVWSRLGRGDLAWAFWDRVTATAVQPWVAAERGRVVRELGLHDEAERLEWPALARAEDPVHDAMLRVSLVANAVGRGDVDGAVRRFDAAAAAVAGLPDGPSAARQRLRLSWVDVEVAALTGRDLRDRTRSSVVRDGVVVHHPDHRHGTDHHRAKSALFAAVTAAADDAEVLLDQAARTAPPVLAWAVWLARFDRGHPDAASRAVAAWGRVVPPDHLADAVAATPTARRLRSLGGDAV